MKKKHKILAIVGPSASGKSSLAIRLAGKVNGEIISADSRLIYKNLDIATAKPDFEEMNGIKHHLIDIKEPTEDYTVADFLDDAKKSIQEIVLSGKTPIVAGGTGLYFRILLENYNLPRVAPNQQLREELEKKSSQELYSMLLELDSKIAEKIHSNNRVKIIRAIEVSKALNLPMSEAQGKKEPDYDVLWVGLDSSDRQFLYKKINLRVDQMIKRGLLEEAKALFGRYPESDILRNTIGYQEIESYLNNECTFEEAVEEIKQNTRRYAKRQLSWFRSNKNINWFYIDQLSEEVIDKTVEEKWINFLENENCL